MQSYEWLFIPWLIYQFLYSLLMFIAPIIIIYVGFEAVDKGLVLLGLLPIGMGLISIYIWIHVKIYFDQLSKAGKPIQIAPIQRPELGEKSSPISITVMSPYPLYEKNHAIFYGGANGPALYQNSFVDPISLPTPLIEEPTPTLQKQLLDRNC